MRTALQGPGCEGWHVAHVARRRPGDLAGSQVARGNGSGEGGAEGAGGPARSPRGLEDRLDRLGNVARGKEPCCRPWGSKEVGRADGPRARNGAAQVRTLQRALSRPSQQDQQRRCSRLEDTVWRGDVLGEAWRQGKARQGAPGVEGLASEAMSNTGDAEERRQTRHEGRRAHRYQGAPVRVVEMPKPQGGTRPLGIATGEARVGPTAMPLVLEPIFAADLQDCSDGYRPKREAKPQPWPCERPCTTGPGASWRATARRTVRASRIGS